MPDERSSSGGPAPLVGTMGEHVPPIVPALPCRIGDFELVREIGRGGMGVVYEARQVSLDRRVAVKILSPATGSDAEPLRRFERESRALAAVEHPSIVAVHCVAEVAGVHLIAMELVRGEPLSKAIPRDGMAAEKLLDSAIQIADALAAAHRQGVVHRDLKPGNIVVTANGRLKVLDFGLAKLSAPAEAPVPSASEAITRTRPTTRDGQVLGTMPYMSPEQLQGRAVDERSDLFSVGIVLHEMATGRRPFAGDTWAALASAILRDSPPPLSSCRPDLPGDLGRIVRRCLQKDPERRYRTAADLRDELEAVRADLASRPAGSPGAIAAARREPPSVAVLPFTDMSPEKDQDYFGEGIAEELIHALARIRGIRVVARTSAFALKGASLDVREIGRRLSVGAVLEGSVRKSGDRLRVTAQLVDAANGFHLWSERFDRHAADVFAIQDEISLAIVEHLKVTLLAGETTVLRKRSTGDPETYSLYLKGIYFSARPDGDSIGKALDFFRQALDRDPTFAAAHAGVGSVFASLGIMNLAPPAQTWPKAKAALAKALALDEDLTEAHVLAASMALWYDWDWDAAEASFRRIFELSPGHAHAHGTCSWLLLTRGRLDEAVREVRRAVDLDPLMPLYAAWSVGIHAAAGHPEDALRAYAQAIEIDPGNGLARMHAGIAYLELGRYDEAVEALEESERHGVVPVWARGLAAIAHARRGSRERVARIYQEDLEGVVACPSYVSAGLASATLGDLDRAFELLDRARESRDLLMPFIHVYARILAPELRTDPRFQTLLAAMKLIDLG
jgi:eukaryotic-like serine/threonine-protein kinase